MTRDELDRSWDRVAPLLRRDGARTVIVVATEREAERYSDRADAVIVAPPRLRVVEGGRR